MRRLLPLCALLAILSVAEISHSQVVIPPATESSPSTPAGSAKSADPLSLRESTQILLPGLGATAAYSLDSLIAEAQIAGGQVRIWARAPGQAVIVLVYSDFSTTT